MADLMTRFPAMDLSLGCMYIGVMLNVWLYGFSIVQAYIYYVHFKTDKPFMRYFVLFLVVADTANAIFDQVFMYQYLVSNFGNLTYAAKSNRSFAADPVTTGVIAFSTQLFFAWRVYKLMHSKIMPALISVGALVSLLSAIGTTIGVEIVLYFNEFHKFQVVVILWLGFAALTDVLITGSLVFTLNKSRTGFAATDDVITKLIRMTLQTGAFTTLFATIDLILFLASTSTLHLVFNLPLAKLYVNSLLSTLNARVTIGSAAQQYTMEGSLSDNARRGMSTHTKRSNFFRSGGNNQPTTIRTQASHHDHVEHGLALGEYNSRDNFATGIHIKTIEETFEERHEGDDMPAFDSSSHNDSLPVLEKSRGDQDSL
ncbi:hypothetical protein NDA11_000710 [Ustilago hordei]|uniref:DUF6534 domain-containing protein n=1 Tax=Ustilago hordei TaxID=120017 RepID=I2G494_USTHO|nr:uncharacterized protein UHO2_01122 [Ustilago hordei]KAJ1043398.1 hypothetical protein NDA10_006226 [Ustilago hordei]KAJ1583087.1 hypothetical protein NDA15_000353 [Ustilago hordei]KAJ1584467.1 hypothetical protein NDA11_000710 [Ustilago hordei]KAJ1592080.1 hypothetical protein NDA12_005464 [Ustilago hordei]UTT94989.1 hypothetical protein NDA17_001428 [Ustilago hordei]